MRFSEAYKIEIGPHDDWFDPHLTIDTKLFIDPMLMAIDESEWTEAHSRLLDHFAACYRLVAKATGNASNSAALARIRLQFPEVEELCLGYSKVGTRGSGSGSGYAVKMLDAIVVAINAGLTEPQHIEELGLFQEGVGPDRISDTVATILKPELIKYTQGIAARHNVPMKPFQLRQVGYHEKLHRWTHGTVMLPANPKSGRGVILVPERFLSELPTVNPTGWLDSEFAAGLRAQLNSQIGSVVSKKRIVELARSNADLVRAWASAIQDRKLATGYNFAIDRLGIVNFDKAPVQYATENPIAGFMAPTTPQELRSLIELVLTKFKHFVEEQRGWELLWNSPSKGHRTPKPESAAQITFFGLAQEYLRLHKVELDREVELGRGPVDFKLSSTSTLRQLIEVKKDNNSKFWNGLEKQLTSYLKSDNSDEGWFVVIRYDDSKRTEERLRLLPARVRQAELDTGLKLHYLVVDARPKLSASKID